MKKTKLSIRKITLSILTFALVLGAIFMGDLQSVKAETNLPDAYELKNAKQEASNDEVKLTKTVEQAVDENGKEIEGQYDITFGTTGKSKTIKTKERLNIVFLLDDSNSMYNINYWGTITGKKDLLVESEKMIKTISDDLLKEFGKTSSSDTEHPGVSFKVITFAENVSSKAWRHDSPVYKTGKNPYDDTTNKGNVGSATFIQKALRKANTELDDLAKTDSSKKGKEIIFLLSDGEPTFSYKDNSSNTVVGNGKVTSSTNNKNTINQATAIKESGKTIFTVGASIDVDVLKQIASYKSGSSTEKYYYTCADAQAVKNASQAVAEAMKEEYYNGQGTITDTLPEWMEYVTSDVTDIQVQDNVIKFPLNVDGKNTTEGTIRVKIKDIDNNGSYLQDGWYKTNLTENNGVNYTYGDKTINITGSTEFYWENTYGYQFNFFKIDEATKAKGEEILSTDLNQYKTGKNPQALNSSTPTKTINLDSTNRSVSIDNTTTKDSIPAEITVDGVTYEFVRFGANTATLTNARATSGNYVSIEPVGIDVIYQEKIVEQDFKVEYYLDDQSSPMKTLSSSEILGTNSKVEVGKTYSIENLTYNNVNIQNAFLNGVSGSSDRQFYMLDTAKSPILSLEIKRNADDNVYKIYYKSLPNNGMATIQFVHYEQEVGSTDKNSIDSHPVEVYHGSEFVDASHLTRAFDDKKHIANLTDVEDSSGVLKNGFTVEAGKTYTVTITHKYKPATVKVNATFVGGPRNQTEVLMDSATGYVSYLSLTDTTDGGELDKKFTDEGYVLQSTSSTTVTPTTDVPDQVINRVYVYKKTAYRVEYYFENEAGDFVVNNDWTTVFPITEHGTDVFYSISDAQQKLVDNNLDSIYELASDQPSKQYVLKVTEDVQTNVIKVKYALSEVEAETTSYTVHFWEDVIGSSTDADNYIGSYTSESLYVDGDVIQLSDIDVKYFLSKDATYMYQAADKQSLTISIEKTDDNVFNVVYVKRAPSVAPEEPKQDNKKEEVKVLPSIATGDTTNALAYLSLLLLATGVFVITKRTRKVK
ncbi:MULTISPECIES: vWA domain-containing protein [unclassified Breznakia]|uniref:vWA domain-containing protein n=1 Tax=unclassified Breznakia TaxID=2623764 RepID=UPI00247548FF|nr:MULTISPECIES: vWA domain-containing protein [unclassified Breznakia]MDH6366732.1 uncharacterized protein YegL [Breznakia sp. PH1-1]MDH6403881.1 uncharacterized protein YegL [Breznakia sp. PF1-11]MDH6411590.1 uncharacterized protein YegL [Breznakia sp. PFB1-11]MDH6413954.1 uncharacterized protein YegL [Breznakia sp. PFB1-14]MDH6416383.1 uncharacterized protein YegL [Breznakia sp. PFB1-4]